MTDPVGEIWDAIDRGEVAKALKLAQKLGPRADDSEAVLATAVAHLEGGDVREARRLLLALAEHGLDGDGEYLRVSYLAQASYALGEMEEALRLLEGLTPIEPDERAHVAWWCGLCFDHLGDPERSDACFQKAVDLDPEDTPHPISITPREVEEIIRQVAERLPERLREVFHELPVVVQDLPSRELILASQGQVGPDTLGLYTGAHLLERSVFQPETLPPTIYIYRRNLERFVETREDLEREIETTLLHELGHHLGYEESDLDELGLQ